MGIVVLVVNENVASQTFPFRMRKILANRKGIEIPTQDRLKRNQGQGASFMTVIIVLEMIEDTETAVEIALEAEKGQDGKFYLFFT